MNSHYIYICIVFVAWCVTMAMKITVAMVIIITVMLQGEFVRIGYLYYEVIAEFGINEVFDKCQLLY